MKSNLMDCYINYKTSRLKKYGLVMSKNSDSFLENVLERYIKTYINSYYYLIFDTATTDHYSYEVLSQELDGRRLEMLEELSINELTYSNLEFIEKKKCIQDTYQLIFILVKLDKMRFDSKDDIPMKVEALLKSTYEQDIIHKVSSLVKETYTTINNFFKENDEYYKLDYQLYKDRDDFVRVVMFSDIKFLKDNYKKALLERVYRDDKLKKEQMELLIKKFVRQLIRDSYYNKKIYQRYFIEFDDYLFHNKDAILEFLEMLDNPFIRRYLTIGLSNNSYLSCASIFKKYKFSLACIQDFSHINDVNTKLNNLDISNIYDYVIVNSYKDADSLEFVNYSGINLKGILFNKDV